jgi:hypothetical protein
MPQDRWLSAEWTAVKDRENDRWDGDRDKDKDPNIMGHGAIRELRRLPPS